MSYVSGPNLPSPSSSSRLHKPLTFSNKRERPTGVTILAALNFIATAIYVILLLSNILAPPKPPQQTASNGQDQFERARTQFEESQASARTMTLVCTSLVGIPSGLAVGIGLWRLYPWGRKLALSLYGGGALLTLLLSYWVALSSSLIGLLISGAAFVYLLRPDVQAAFYDAP